MTKYTEQEINLASLAHDCTREEAIENGYVDSVIASRKQYGNDIQKTKYKSSRLPEYPSIGDQLDDLFKAGMFSEEMAAKIQAVKDKYPKP